MGKIVRTIKGVQREQEMRTKMAAVIKVAAYRLFDRVPRGGVIDAEIDKLVEELFNIK